MLLKNRNLYKLYKLKRIYSEWQIKSNVYDLLAAVSFIIDSSEVNTEN